jgi:hypothetical protein
MTSRASAAAPGPIVSRRCARAAHRSTRRCAPSAAARSSRSFSASTTSSRARCSSPARRGGSSDEPRAAARGSAGHARRSGARVSGTRISGTRPAQRLTAHADRHAANGQPRAAHVGTALDSRQRRTSRARSTPPRTTHARSTRRRRPGRRSFASSTAFVNGVRQRRSSTAFVNGVRRTAFVGRRSAPVDSLTISERSDILRSWINQCRMRVWTVEGQRSSRAGKRTRRPWAIGARRAMNGG